MSTLPPPTAADVAYGPHPAQRYDFWRAGPGVTPLVVFIHGGGWTGADRRIYLDRLLPLFLEAGFSYATAGYRFTTEAPLPAPVHDAGRAVQHLRLHARAYGIDPDRLGLFGTSAGACTAFNLALGPDLADPAAADPASRPSSRPRCAAGKDGQTALDPHLLREWLGDDILLHRMLYRAVGEPSAAAMLDRYAQHRATFARFSPILQVRPDTAVPLFLEYTPRQGLATALPARGAGATRRRIRRAAGCRPRPGCGDAAGRRRE